MLASHPAAHCTHMDTDIATLAIRQNMYGNSYGNSCGNSYGNDYGNVPKMLLVCRGIR
ncbi:hypothetical protein BDW22DRAFT_1352403 [Trametopsis cervina]|nr:hypothetical protein BDW22DRAFT_1352403 [Trametopsis cervina]